MPRTSFQCKGWLCLVDFFNYNCGIAKPSDLRSWFLTTTMCLRGGKTLWCSGNRTWAIDEQAPPANALSTWSIEVTLKLVWKNNGQALRKVWNSYFQTRSSSNVSSNYKFEDPHNSLILQNSRRAGWPTIPASKRLTGRSEARKPRIRICFHLTFWLPNNLTKSDSLWLYQIISLNGWNFCK